VRRRPRVPDRTVCVTHPSPPAALGRDHAAVSYSACRLPAQGAWVGRHGCAGETLSQRDPRLPVCGILCLGRVLHARTRLNEALATSSLSHHVYPSPPRVPEGGHRPMTTVPDFAPQGNKPMPAARWVACQAASRAHSPLAGRSG
jgi:hypothetical protein